MPNYRVHHLVYSRSLRILWMLEEMGATYEIVTYHRDKAFRAPPELEEIHPLGRAPVLEADGVVMAESGAILEFLADHHPELRPEPGTPEHQNFRFWMHYAEGSIMPPLLVRLLFDKVGSAKVPFFIKPVVKGIVDKVDKSYTDDQVGRHLRFMNQQLADREYFVGDTFSAADIQMIYAVDAGLERGRVDGLTNLSRWQERMADRPAYQRALEKGGPALPPAR